MTTALLQAVARIAQAAGDEIMRIYATPFSSTQKSDKSPVTEADHRAEALILEALHKVLPDVPVISEEAASAGHIPKVGRRFVLVDPLDGTKEFLARNGEFTVNIALIEDGAPVLGVVHAPALGRLFAGEASKGALELQTSSDGAHTGFENARAIRVRPAPLALDALWSRTHDTYRADEYRDLYAIGAVRAIGSSIKFALIAAGEADIYPRHGPTMEWDTAAGQAVLEAAGGSVRDLQGRRLTYGRASDNFKNPHFVARGA